jgi:hypothetical protein
VIGCIRGIVLITRDLPTIVAMDRWLARLSFSFFIIAAVLVWETYKSLVGERGVVPQWRIALYMLATVICITLGAMGERARPRPRY